MPYRLAIRRASVSNYEKSFIARRRTKFRLENYTVATNNTSLLEFFDSRLNCGTRPINFSSDIRYAHASIALQ